MGAVLPKNNSKVARANDNKQILNKDCYDDIFSMYEKKYRDKIIKQKKILNSPIKLKKQIER